MVTETFNLGTTHTMDIFGRIMISFLFGVVFSFNAAIASSADENKVTVASPNYTVIEGEWQRTDGDYVIKVSDVQTDGRATVEYFNPRPINVVKAALSTQKELIRLLIKFQDKGYEGSIYTLYYYAEKDALAGFYYQAPMDRTYEVIFLRKKGLQQ